MSRCVLVTGGCGAIGSEVINRLKSMPRHRATTFVNFDALTYAGKQDNIEPPYANYRFVRGDITDIQAVKEALAAHKPQYVIHFAAETHVDNSFGNSLKFTTTNVLGTHVLLECVKEYILSGNDFRAFIHMSTDEVYGSVDDAEAARSEEALFAPSNPYAATKAGAEMICLAYQKSFGLPIIIVRCNNAVSKYQHEEKLVPKAVSCILGGRRVPIHGEGKSKRTFIHAYDIASAMDVIMDRGVVGSTYNIGTYMEYTVLDVVGVILEEMGYSSASLADHVEFIPDRAFQDYRYCIDSSALRALGWTERINFRQAVRDVVDRSLHTSAFSAV